MMKAPAAPVDEKISTIDAAEIAHVDERTIRRWCEAGLIAFEDVSLGSRHVYKIWKLPLLAYLVS